MIFTEAAPEHGCDAQADGKNGGACRRLCLSCACHGDRQHRWQSCLDIFSPSTQCKRENNNGESNVHWKNMGFTGALSGLTVPSVSFHSGAAGWRRKGVGHICLILYALSFSSQCLCTLVTECSNSGSPIPLHPVPFEVLFSLGKAVVSSQWHMAGGVVLGHCATLSKAV